MAKDIKTLSLCLPTHIVEQLDVMALELNVSRSAVATAMLSVLCKWSTSIDVKEIIENGK